MAASQSVLEIVIQAIDESGAALSGAENNLKEVAQEAIATGVQLTIAGAAITAAYSGVVYAAASVQESQDTLKQAVTDAMAGASTSTGSYATQVQFLKDKIDGYKASIAQATATLDTNTGSAEKSAASHAKAAADIATAQLNIQKYQQQLDVLTNSQDLNGQSITDITGKLESQANANVSLGFSVSESTASLAQAFTATKNVSEAMQVNQAAMDLARAKNIDLATATNQVILAMNGQGRALATYGIQIKDGLSGMSALQAVQGAVNGQAQAYSETLNGQVSVAMQSVNKLFVDMGNTQLPALTHLFEIFVHIIDAVDNFAQKHQKLTEIILLSVGIFGVLLTTVGTLLVIFGTLTLIVLAVGAPFLLLIGLIAVLAATIISNWGALKDDMAAIWQVIQTAWQGLWNAMKSIISTVLGWIDNFIGGTLTDIQTVWNAVWGGVSTFFMGIWDGMKTAITDAINYIKGIISQFVSWATGIFAPITSTISAIGGAASGIMNAARGAVSGAASVIGIHDAIITPSGQVIQSDPADYLFATKNPSSLGGGSGVTVNVNGGLFLSDQAATMFANQVAKIIGRQLKLRNYAV